VLVLTSAAAASLLLASCASMTGKEPMSFFVSSTGSGKGGDLGGLAGADALCQKLAAAAGAGNKTWRAYLSLQGANPSEANPQGVPAIHARDRIGSGPWYNAKGELIARDVAQLHDGNNLNKQTAVDERGNAIKGSGDPSPIEHDILTGSRADGTAFAPHTDTTCKGWTSSNEGSAVVGHHDRLGLTNDPWSKSWSFSHQTVGCSQQALVRTGGSGRLYCFASN
jgi:hypothetical protein